MKQKVICMLIGLLASAFAFAQNSWPQVILRGDYPDPSIVRDGKDYYMTHSPFCYAPGFLIWHSQDLVNWEPVCRALPEWKGSAMAPDLVKYNDRYYIYFPAAGTNWVTYADDIRGPWSEPVDLKVSGIDPGHIADEQGNRYLFLNEGAVIALTADGLATVGEKRQVYDGWDYPRQWKVEGKYLESPKLIYRDGYFYMTSAEGGTAGPATSHMCVMARAKQIMGPWENSPYNPVVHTFSASESWWSKGHGTLIDDVNGNWWMVYHAYANGYHTLGRQTLLEPMQHTADGWFKPAAERECLPQVPGFGRGLDLNDDFAGAELGLQWTFWKENARKELSVGQGRMQLKGKGTSPADARLLLTTPEDKAYETQVTIEIGKRNKAGLVLFYNEKAFVGVVCNEKQFIVYRDATHSETHPNRLGNRFRVRLLNRGNRVTMQVGKDGAAWTTLAENVDVSSLHHNNYHGFYALRIGLMSAGEGTAVFRDFRYRHAVPQEEADRLEDYWQKNKQGKTVK